MFISTLVGQTVASLLVVGMSLDIHVFAGAFSMNSFQDLDGKSCTLVEPKSSKQWKSLCKSDNSRFLCVFDCLEFREK